MSSEDLARRFKARREGRNYRAKCPVHKSRGVSLGLYPKKDRTILVCYAGCLSDDILTSVGLSWKDAIYSDKFLTPSERKEWARKKSIEGLYHAEQRSQALKLWKASLDCKWKPIRTKSTFDVRGESYGTNRRDAAKCLSSWICSLEGLAGPRHSLTEDGKWWPMI